METTKWTFSDLVKPDYVVVDLKAATKEEALRIMAERLVQEGYCKESFVQGILDREQHHPSALPMPGYKIAIPHTDASHVNRSVIYFARLSQPLEFLSMGSMDEVLQVPMISMLALKEKERIGDLLETLITAYQDEEVLNKIMDAETSQQVFRILQAKVEESEQSL